MNNFYNFTNYPNIFKNCYWGNHQDSEQGLEHCYANRNFFVKEYKIDKVCKITSGVSKIIARKYFNSDREWIGTGTVDWADHVEIYKTKDNKKVIICSPYDKSIELYLELTKLGWMRYNDLYTNSAATYILVIDEMKIKEEIIKEKLIKKQNIIKNKQKKREELVKNKLKKINEKREQKKTQAEIEKQKEEAIKKQKEYYQKNKEEILKRAKQYSEQKKKLREKKDDEWFKKNEKVKKHINFKNEQNIKVCGCGSVITKGNIAKHKRTKKHINFINEQKRVQAEIENNENDRCEECGRGDDFCRCGAGSPFYESD